MAAAVLMQSLVVGPVGRRDVAARGRLLVVPLGKPDVVGLGIRRAVLRDQVGDARARAAVDAREVALRVQLRGPSRQEREHRGGVGRGPRIVLHVVVDGVAGRNPNPLRVGDGVDRGCGALRRGLAGRDRRAAAGVAGRLQAHIERNHVPAGCHLVDEPGGSEVRLCASAVRPADVDPDRAVWRSAPRRHRSRGWRGARVKPEASERRRRRVRGRRGPGARPDHGVRRDGRLGGRSRAATAGPARRPRSRGGETR